MKSIVITQVKASILRHRLFARLAGRRDIVAPDLVAPGLARLLPRFLVAGLDDDREPGTGGWPVFTGGRYVKACFSAVLDGREDEAGAGRRHRLPRTSYQYVRYVEHITGFGANEAPDLLRLHGFEPAQLFDLCRPMQKDCPPAWRLLLSHEWALATRLWPDLGRPLPRQRFTGPLVDAFRMLAEAERAVLMGRHLANARRLLDRRWLLEALASPLPLSRWFKPDELVEVCRWLEYAIFSSTALTDLMVGRDVAGILALPGGYAPWALARGGAIEGVGGFLDHPEVRAALIKVFGRPPLAGERKRSTLRNDDLPRWYGLTGELMPVITLDDMLVRYPSRKAKLGEGRVAPSRDAARAVLSHLGSAMRTRADPAMQQRLVEASEPHLGKPGSGNPKSATLEGLTKRALDVALRYLPAHDVLGGAARFDPKGWDMPPRDAELWRAIIAPERAVGLLRAHPRRRQLLRAIAGMRRAYGPLFAQLNWSKEVEQVICDMACALSPISVDPHIAFAVHALGQNPSLQEQLRMRVRSG